MLLAENKIRSWAELFPKSYIMAIFACDRTIYHGFQFVPRVDHQDTIKAQITALESMMNSLQQKIELIDGIGDINKIEK